MAGFQLPAVSEAPSQCLQWDRNKAVLRAWCGAVINILVPFVTSQRAHYPEPAVFGPVILKPAVAVEGGVFSDTLLLRSWETLAKSLFHPNGDV